MPGLGAIWNADWATALICFTTAVAGVFAYWFTSLLGPFGFGVGALLLVLAWAYQMFFLIPERYLRKSGVWEWILPISSCILYYVICLCVLIFLKQWIAPMELFSTDSNSMSPTINSGEIFVANRRAYINAPIRRGDVVVFTDPRGSKTKYLKRVIAVAGDKIQFSANGQVRLNGNLLLRTRLPDYLQTSESQLSYEETVDSKRFTILVRKTNAEHIDDSLQEIPVEYVFLLGDNRGNSLDSRHWGAVSRANIIGRIEYSIWSFGRPSLKTTQ